MSRKRFWWSVVAVWAVIAVTDWLFHGVWLQPWYAETPQLWRTQEEMQGMMPWLWFGTAIYAWAFVWIYSKGISKDNQWIQAFRYGLAILLVAKVPEQIGLWATAPYSTGLVWRWFLVASVQAFLAAFVMTWTFKPSEVWKATRAKN